MTFNNAYASALGDLTPTRTTVAVAGLPQSALLEIAAIAYTGPQSRLKLVSKRG